MRVLVNLDDKVRAQLTDAGMMQLKSKAAEHLLLSFPARTVDCTLWELANVFGPVMYSGNPTPPFVNMVIELYVPQV